MNVRRARPGDRTALASFRCSDGTPRQSEIERWIQRKALNWQKSSAHNELHVLVHDDEVIGVYAFRPASDDSGWFIVGLAVAISHQNRGIGRALLETCLDQLQRRTPGGWAYWNVDAGNGPSHAISRHIGEADPSPTSAKLTTYTVRL